MCATTLTEVATSGNKPGMMYLREREREIVYSASNENTFQGYKLDTKKSQALARDWDITEIIAQPLI